MSSSCTSSRAERGLFATLRQSITHVTTDARLQLLLVAFAFGAFFEGAAGFGTPVAVTGALLIGLGFAPLAASGLSLIANTAPVAFGALGTPIIALSAVSGLDLLRLERHGGPAAPALLGARAVLAGRRLRRMARHGWHLAGDPRGRRAIRRTAVPRLEPARTVARRCRRLDRVDGRRSCCSCASGTRATAGTLADALACGMDEGAADAVARQRSSARGCRGSS